MKYRSRKLKSMDELKRLVFRTGRLIGARRADLPTLGGQFDDGNSFVIVSSKGYHYIVQDRGTEIRRQTTNDLDRLLYWIFEDVTFAMAIRQLTSNNKKKIDQRRIYFELQEQLMGKLNPEWGDKIRKKHAALLEEFPFDDLAALRAQYCKQLRDKGSSDEDAWQMACKKYPLPKQQKQDNSGATGLVE